jgi:hypothetical protein
MHSRSDFRLLCLFFFQRLRRCPVLSLSFASACSCTSSPKLIVVYIDCSRPVIFASACSFSSSRRLRRCRFFFVCRLLSFTFALFIFRFRLLLHSIAKLIVVYNVFAQDFRLLFLIHFRRLRRCRLLSFTSASSSSTLCRCHLLSFDSASASSRSSSSSTMYSPSEIASLRLLSFASASSSSSSSSTLYSPVETASLSLSLSLFRFRFHFIIDCEIFA